MLARRFVFVALVGVLVASIGGQLSAQTLTPEQQAAQVLNAGRRAYNEKQFPAAADRFREYIKSYSNQRDITAARYGLGLTLLDGNPRDLKGAVEVLNQAAGDGGFVERPFVLHYLGAAHRAQGHEATQLAEAKPAEAPQHRQAAAQRYTEAAKWFGDATAAFLASAKVAEAKLKEAPEAKPAEPPKPDPTKPPPPAVNPALSNPTLLTEWSARSRCDQAEMLLRTDKLAEAREATKPFLEDKTLAPSRYRPQGLYLNGSAQFQLKDYAAAGRALAELAPFNDPVVGVHSRYLLARTHHVLGEREEALEHYQAVVAGHEARVKFAQNALQNPQLNGNPDEKLRLEAVVKTVPDYLVNTHFHWGVLLYEQRLFAEAAERFNQFATRFPQSTLVPEARLRQGFCQVEQKQNAEALKTLQPLSTLQVTPPQPPLADRALLWMARAQRGLADPAQPPQFEQSQKQAIEWLKQAMDRANQAAAQDPEARIRRVEIQLELADTQIAAKVPQEAAGVYQTVLNENVVPDRGEETMQRLTTALHLSKQWDPCDQLCAQFEQKYPQSTLLGAVLFRKAENAYHKAATIDPTKPTAQVPARQQTFQEAIKRFEALLAKFPEFEYAGVARFHEGLAYEQLGDYEKMIAVLKEIPQPDQQGELTATSYHLADALMRTLPTGSDDALAAGRLVQQLGQIIGLLEGFIGGNEKSPLLPDALIKLGVCTRQMAGLTAEPNERNQTFQKSRQAFERVTAQFAQHPLMPTAVYERARVLLDQNDIGGAFNEFTRFKAAPLNTANVAPLAWLRASAILRAQNKPQEAADLLNAARGQYEGPLAGDPTRVDWIPLLQYHHGLALREAAKLPDSQKTFEAIVQKYPNWSDAPQAAWRAGQVRREDALLKYTAARTLEAKPDAKPEQLAQAKKDIDDSLVVLRDVAKYFRDQANQLAQKKLAGQEIQLRMFYESAWSNRTVADVEVGAARKKLAEDAFKKLQEQLAKNPPPMPKPGDPPAPKAVDLRPPEIAITAVPLQPAETAMREAYTALIAAAADAPLSLHARLELAELHAQRDQFDAAIPLLVDAIDQEPPTELEERLRLRLGTCLLAKKDPDAAAEQFASVAGNAKSPLSPEAKYRTAECYLQKEDFAKAIAELVPFRDQGPLHNIPGVSDRAVLRLGHAYAHAKQWDPSRQAFEILTSRYPQSPWRFEARYGIGWAWQNQQSYDNAANTYATVVRETGTEVAARAQIQTGLCRLAQKKPAEALSALLAVPLTYDYPEWNAMALVEAARVSIELQQPIQAVRLLERVRKEYPDTPWSKIAVERLMELQKAAGPLTAVE